MKTSTHIFRSDLGNKMQSQLKILFLLFFSTLTVNNSFGQTGIPPVAICQNFSVFLDFSGTKFISPQNINGGSFDPDGTIVNYSLDQDLFTCADLGVNVVTLTVEDNDGNTASCMANVNVSWPSQTLACISQVNLSLDINGMGILEPEDVLAGVFFDPCDLFTVTPSEFTCDDIGQHTVTVEDGAGNSCWLTVIVEDKIPPTFIYPEDVIIVCGESTDPSITGEPIIIDNCGTYGTSYFDQTLILPGNIVIIHRIWTIIEWISGDIDTHIQVLDLEDDQTPVAICAANLNISLDQFGMATLTPEAIDAGSYDDCGPLTYMLSDSIFDCSNIQDNISVILTVSDASGNSSQCWTQINVEDKLAPVVTCPPDLTLDCSQGGNLDPSVTGEPTVIDNCDLIGMTYEDQYFQISGPNFKVVRTWIVVDWYSVTFDTCYQVIKVQDVTGPNLTCLNQVTASLDNSGSLTIFPQDLILNDVDDCDSTTLSVVPNVFDCSNIGDNTVIVTSTDGSGNISQCSVTLTIQDNTPPIAICNSVVNVSLGADGTATITPDVIDAGSFDECGGPLTFMLSDSIFDCSNIQDNISVVLTVTDSSGNSNQCWTQINVEDKIAPVVTCPLDLTIDCSAGDNLDPSITGEPTVIDACGFIGTAYEDEVFQLNGVNIKIIRTWTIIDWNTGDIVSCEQVINIEDNKAPTLFCIGMLNASLDATGNLTLYPEDFDLGTFDDCGAFTLSIDQSEFDCSNVGSNIITLTATDENGNNDFCLVQLNLIAADLDGDGYTICNGDCNDDDNTISPAAEEICGDEIDNNCNGDVDEDCLCNSNAESTQYEWIDAISINGQTNNTGNDNGYGDYSSVIMPLTLGSNDIVLTPGFAGSPYNEFWTVWIDLNQNGEYDIDEEVFSDNSNGTITDVLSIPSSALLGTTTMRISMKYNESADPCEIFPEGEVEDYTVIISEPIYCDSEGQSTQYEWIKKVRLKSINNLSGDDNGYGDYTNLSTNLNPGQNKNIILKPGFSNGSYTEYWRVWIDWNEDGDFDDSGELEVQVSTSGNTTQQITVPNNASGGNKLMRVSMKYGGYPQPCEIFTFGEVEDYTIFITGNNPLIAQEASPGTVEMNSIDLHTYEAEQEIVTREKALELKVRLFPNPTSNFINIEINSTRISDSKITMYNQVGQLVFEAKTDLSNYIIDVMDNKFTNGMYVIIIEQDGKVESKKIIVSK